MCTPRTLLLYSKTGVCSIPIFLIFALKHRLWVPTIYVLIKNKKNSKHFLLKIFNFHNFKNLCILHGQVFVMVRFHQLVSLAVWLMYMLLLYPVNLIKYTTQTMISIKTLLLLKVHTASKMMLKTYSKTIAVQTWHLFFALTGSASRRVAETMETP